MWKKLKITKSRNRLGKSVIKKIQTYGRYTNSETVEVGKRINLNRERVYSRTFK